MEPMKTVRAVEIQRFHKAMDGTDDIFVRIRNYDAGVALAALVAPQNVAGTANVEAVNCFPGLDPYLRASESTSTTTATASTTIAVKIFQLCNARKIRLKTSTSESSAPWRIAGRMPTL